MKSFSGCWIAGCTDKAKHGEAIKLCDKHFKEAMNYDGEE